MVTEVSDLLLELARVVAAEEARQAASRAGIGGAATLVQHLPWVHRTGRTSDWRLVFDERRLCPKPSSTRFERALGLDRSVYLFIGSCAFPRGTVALLVASQATDDVSSTFTPYDSGALKEYVFPVTSDAAWDDAAKTAHLRAHLGRGVDLVEFAGPYIAAHFHDPIDYVRRPQDSAPDFPPYHGLVSDNVDRRLWTIEARVHRDVEFSSDGLCMEEIWLDHQDLVDELPDDFKHLARVTAAGERLAAAVARRIEQRIGEAIHEMVAG